MINIREPKKLLNMQNIHQKFEDQATVKGQIVFADPAAEIFKVRIGQNDDNSFIEGILPFSEFSVQNFKLIETDSNNKKVLGKDAFFSGGNWITCDILSMSKTDIYLSRKSHQVIPFYNLQIGTEVTCTVKSLNHPFTFVEISHELIALNLIQELSNTKYSDVKNWFKIGDQFKAIITEITPDKKIFVSKREYYKKHFPNDIKEGLMVPGKIGSKVDGGYFVELTPTIAGIMDVTDDQIFTEGQNILCIVNRINQLPNGKTAYHLEYCNYLDY